MLATALPPDRPTAQAQEPQRPPQDTLRADSTRADSIIRVRRAQDSVRAVADSLNPDSLRPVMPMLGPPPGPLPQGRRYVFEYDALRWSGALTLGELLTWVPGVFLVRIASVGQGEAVSYNGQGASSIEIYMDGYAVDPLGVDSNGYDTGRFDLGMLQRVEVEVFPTVLRVHLISDTQAARKARTEASFSTGDASTNAYRLRYLNRWGNGFGLNVGASYFGTVGPLTSRGKVGLFQLMAKATWLPTDRSGVEFQVNAWQLTRELLTPLRGGLPDLVGVEVRRSDVFLRAFSASRSDGRGLRLDAMLGSSSVTDSSGRLDAHSSQASLTVGYRTAHLSAEGWGRLRDTHNPLDVGLRAGFSPLRQVTLTGEARRRSILGGGYFSELSGGGELRPVSGVSLHGDVRQRVIADSLYTFPDTTERVSDWRAGLMLSHRLALLDLTYGSNGDFTAPIFGIYHDQLPGRSTVGSTGFQGSWQIRPWPWMTLSGWLRLPDNDSVPLDPPTHSMTRLTLRSQFLPHFRRNAFDAEVQLEMEAWGTGVAGIDSTGAGLPLSGQSIFNVHVQFRLVGALVFWTFRNALRTQYGIIPGYDLPRSFQRFGLRWEFTN